MYATIRRYTPKGDVDQKAIDEFRSRIEDGFLPIADKEILSISVFEDRTGASESTRRAAEFVKKDPMKDRLGTPEVLEGDVLVSKESPVGAH